VWKLKSPIIEDHQLLAILASRKLLAILASRRRLRETITRLFRRRGGAIVTTRIGGQLSLSDRQMGVACVWKLKSPIINDHHLLAILVLQKRARKETITRLFGRRGGAVIMTQIGGRLIWSDRRMGVACVWKL
jgi:hypothetical protein